MVIKDKINTPKANIHTFLYLMSRSLFHEPFTLFISKETTSETFEIWSWKHLIQQDHCTPAISFYGKDCYVVKHFMVMVFLQCLKRMVEFNVLPFHFWKMKYLIRILDNPFLSSSYKYQLTHFFCILQKQYRGFSRLARIWKLKKASIIVNTDLYFNKLNPSLLSTTVVFQNQKLFYFSLNDLLRIIQSSLCSYISGTFELNSSLPKNPYNNEVFKEHDLYNIYFCMKSHKELLSFPILFHLFFLENFCLASFTLKYEVMIREFCIESFVYSVDGKNAMVWEDILDMLSQHKLARLWVFHPKAPRSAIVDIMRPYLHLYYLVHYSGLSTDQQCDKAEDLLESKLTSFFQFNGLFGQKKTSNELLWGKNSFKTTVCAEIKPLTIKMEFNLLHPVFVRSSKWYLDSI